LLSFISLVSLCISPLSCLAACNTAQSMLCRCFLTACISGSSFQSTNSNCCVISTVWVAANCIRPLPPCFLGIYKRSTSALGWCYPLMVSSFLVFQFSVCGSAWCQLTVAKLYLSMGTANGSFAWILFFALNSVPRTNVSLNYSFFNSGIPRNFVVGGGRTTKSVEDRGQREGGLGVVAP
jgi:hypothetical protein